MYFDCHGKIFDCKSMEEVESLREWKMLSTYLLCHLEGISSQINRFSLKNM